MYKTSGMRQGYIVYEWRGEGTPTKEDRDRLNSILGKVDINKSTDTQVFVKLGKRESPMVLEDKPKRGRK